jgi:hypothetical protein
MNSTPSKVFTVVVVNCQDWSHTEKIAALLRRSFPHRAIFPEPASGFSTMLLADNVAAVRAAVSHELGLAKLVCAEMSWLADDGSMSHIPPDFILFDAPR